MQKVVFVNVWAAVESNPSLEDQQAGKDKIFEIESEKLNGYLQEGYYVKQVQQIAPSPDHALITTYTFVLEK